MCGFSDKLYIKNDEAVLRRWYFKGGKYIFPYMTYLEKAKIVMKGIGAYMFQTSYEIESKLPPYSTDENLVQYFEKYFLIQKERFLKTVNSDPKLFLKNNEKEFNKKHLQEEKEYMKVFFPIYKQDFKNEEDFKKKEEYIKAYFAWVQKKKEPWITGKKLKNLVVFILKRIAWSI